MVLSANHSLRKATSSEVEEIKRLIHKTIEICYVNFHDLNARKSYQNFHSTKKISNRIKCGNTLVIVEDHEIVATGASLENKIFGVFVRPDRQGKGYGKKTVEALEQELISQGVNKFTIDISLASAEFYKALGYHITGETNIELGEGSVLKYYHGEKENI